MDQYDSNSGERGRKKTLLKKFGLHKEFLEHKDLESLIEKMDLNKDFTKEEIQKMFDELDIYKTGKVSLEQLVDNISKHQSSSSSPSKFSAFYNQINQELVTKSERIIQKLKLLKTKAASLQDKESKEEIEWIISSLSEDIYEPELDILSSKSEDFHMFDALSIISSYSKGYEKRERDKDIAIASKKKKTTTSLAFRKSHSLGYTSMVEGIMNRIIDRKSSTLSELSGSVIQSVSLLLENIDSFDFNIFKLDELIDKRTLHFMTSEIFNHYNYFEEIIDEEKYKNFIKEITHGYNRDVVYHNDLHAGDVMQTVYVMIEKGELMNKLNLNDVDIIAILLAAMCHDFRHNGFNNMFHINDKSHIAITYNDASVLESYHVAETFKVMIKEENNLLCNLLPEEWRLVRRRMIDCILSTDMANHTKHLSTLKSKMETFDIKNGKNVEKMIFKDNIAKTYENQQIILGMCIHSADISNPAKPAAIYKTWVDLVFKEFFHQGDTEKKKVLPVSLLCDRDTTNINKSQIGFINFVVIPSFDTLINFMPEINTYFNQVKKSLKYYEELVQEDEKKIKK